MDQLVQFYIKNSLAQSTQRTYQSGQKRYMTFCISQNINPFPVSENNLCQFVAQLAHKGISHQSIKGYLSAIRHQQISLDHPNPYICKMPKLEQVIKGIKGIQTKQGSTPRTRLPITPTILLKLREFWELNARSFDHIMLWAAACLCFFGFLRCGEITVPSTTSYDPGAHLSVGDIAVDNLTAPQAIQVHIKASKTDPFRQGIYIYVGRTDTNLCPVAAIISYIQARGQTPGPLFRFASGQPLTRDSFVKRVREGLQAAGINAAHYAGHSFRIGAATTAAAQGVEDSLIKTLGRWESSAYLLYIRIPRDRLTQISKQLVTGR